MFGFDNISKKVNSNYPFEKIMSKIIAADPDMVIP